MLINVDEVLCNDVSFFVSAVSKYNKKPGGNSPGLKILPT